MVTRRLNVPPQPKPDVHVVPHYDGWATMRNGGARVSRLCATREDAIEIGGRSARRDKVKLVIHAGDGTVEKHFDYGRDAPTSHKRG